MEKIDKIIDVAEDRGLQMDVTYTGVLMPMEANALLENKASVKLIDVRSTAELDLVGKVPGAIHIEWAFYPGMMPNPGFSKQLEAQVKKDDLVIFMCRAGNRSHNAAITAYGLGYNDAYNMLEGFEGHTNENKQRTLINGWKHASLPWTN